MASPPIDADPFFAGPPQRVRDGGKTLIVVGAVAVLGIVALLLTLLLTKESPDEGFRAGSEFTCSDGTFTLSLPYGWRDSTDQYRSDYFEDNGVESGIEGFVILDHHPYIVTENFVTMSGHDRSVRTASADAILVDSASDWSGHFDDLPSSTSGESTTDAGDEIRYTTLHGKKDGSEWQVMLVVVTGDDSYATFILETRVRHTEAADDLLSSAKTLVFAPVDSTETPVDSKWYLPHEDGRTYSSEGGASLIIPESWIYIGQMWDSEALDPSEKFDFLGFWQIGGAEGDNPFDITSISIVSSLNYHPDLTAVEMLASGYGAVGETTTDPSGVTVSVEALDDWDVPGVDDAARARVILDYSTASEALFDGRVVDGVGYVLMQGDRLINVSLTFPGPLDESVVASIEEILKTIEFHLPSS